MKGFSKRPRETRASASTAHLTGGSLLNNARKDLILQRCPYFLISDQVYHEDSDSDDGFVPAVKSSKPLNELVQGFSKEARQARPSGVAGGLDMATLRWVSR